MRKITILEGADCMGKTMLAQELARRGHGRIIHLGPPDPNIAAWQQYLSVLDQLPDGDVIFDRFHLGERVYGPLLRNEDTLGAVGQRLVERALLSLGRVVMIHCQTLTDSAVDRWQVSAANGKELITDRDVYRRCVAEYDFMMRQSHLPTLRYDFTNNAVDGLERCINVWCSAGNQAPGMGEFIVGQALVIARYEYAWKFRWPNLPFTEGSWLTAAVLEQSRVKERDVYWLPLRFQTKRPTRDVYERLNPSVVIAIDGPARKWCEGLKIPFVSLPSIYRWSTDNPYVYPIAQLIANGWERNT